MADAPAGLALRRTTGALFVIGALTFAAAATVLSSTFDWPDVLRRPADVVLPAFVAGGTPLVWTWFATAWTYALLLVPVLLLAAALGRRGDPVLHAAGYVGANQVALLVVTTLAASRGKGDVSAYVMAFVFFQLPHGLLAVSLMTTLEPGMSSAINKGDLRAFRRTFGYGLRLMSFAIAPAAAGYVVLAHPLVSLLLERGEFDAGDAARTATVLVGLAVLRRLVRR